MSQPVRPVLRVSPLPLDAAVRPVESAESAAHHATHLRRWRGLSTAATLLALAACGGGGGGGAGSTTPSPAAPAPSPTTPAPSPTPPSISTAASFPVGLAIASPGEVGTGASAKAAPWRTAQAWGRSLGAALWQGDHPRVAGLLTQALPLGEAQAAGAGSPTLVAAAEIITKVLDGDSSVSLASVLDLPALFGSGATNAACYGPQLLYASHQDAGSGTASGQLPSGDLGLWLANEPGSGEPCAVAQMERRVRGVKQQGMQGLLLAALMRGVVARTTGLALPAAGATTDLTTALTTALSTGMPGVPLTVVAATIGLDSAGQYTYRLVLSNAGTGAAAKRGEMVLRHVPGSTTGEYSGTLQVAGFSLDGDAAFGCTDQVDSGSGQFKVAYVSSLKYSRNGSTVAFGSRNGRYCGHPSGTGSDDAAEVAGFTSDFQLDPTAKTSGSTRGAGKGWRGNFTRYAASYDKDSAAGSFLLHWQAGPGDGNARAMAATAGVNSAGDRTVKAYYAYADDIATTRGALLGMVCNWAGPGNSHAANLKFQSQAATLASGGSAFVLDSSLITYAPTVSCSSTTTSFDVNADGTLASGEGVGTAANLDGVLGSATTVDAELSSRGYTAPGLF